MFSSKYITGGSRSEAGCKYEDHMVCDSDRSSEVGSELAHDVNCLMTGDAQGGNLTHQKLDGTRLRGDGREGKKETPLVSFNNPS